MSHVNGIRQPVNPNVRNPTLYSAPTPRSCENEVKEFIQALVNLTKPDTVLEVGVAEGWTTLAIAAALDRNGVGTLHAIDLEPPTLDIDHPRVEFHQMDFRAFTPPATVDLAFMDATLDEKDQEVLHFSSHYQPGTILLLHNVGMGRLNKPDKPKRAEVALARVSPSLYRRVHFRTPAGLTILEWL
jgi:predicted O-methyltransferase YrrM